MKKKKVALHGWKREGIGDFGGEWDRHFPGEAIEAFVVKERGERGERNGFGPCCTRMEKGFIEEKLQTPERRFAFQFMSSFFTWKDERERSIDRLRKAKKVVVVPCRFYHLGSTWTGELVNWKVFKCKQLVDKPGLHKVFLSRGEFNISREMQIKYQIDWRYSNPIDYIWGDRAPQFIHNLVILECDIDNS